MMEINDSNYAVWKTIILESESFLPWTDQYEIPERLCIIVHVILALNNHCYIVKWLFKAEMKSYIVGQLVQCVLTALASVCTYKQQLIMLLRELTVSQVSLKMGTLKLVHLPKQTFSL